MIALDRLVRFAPHIDPAIAAELAPALSAEADAASIVTPLRIAHWMAQMSVECAGFTRFSENLNYRAEGLTATWPTHFPAPIAASYAHQPEKIANRAYAGRMGNGDEASGDGWRFRGRGLLQTTGRAGYVQASGFTGGLDLIADPDALANPDAVAARVAAGFWRAANCNAEADADDIAGVTRKINGGLIGLADRETALARAKLIWGA